jgi:hypothetical protein
MNRPTGAGQRPTPAAAPARGGGSPARRDARRAEPGSRQEHGKPKREQLDDVQRDRPLGAEPGGAHGEDRDPDGLEHGALLVLLPAAQAAPDGHQNPGKAGHPAQHTVEEADARIRRRAGLDRRQGRARESVEAIENQESRHAFAHLGRIGKGENPDAEWDTERGTEEERP